MLQATAGHEHATCGLLRLGMSVLFSHPRRHAQLKGGSGVISPMYGETLYI